KYLPHLDPAPGLDLAGVGRTQRAHADAVLLRNARQSFAARDLVHVLDIGVGPGDLFCGSDQRRWIEHLRARGDLAVGCDLDGRADRQVQTLVALFREPGTGWRRGFEILLHARQHRLGQLLAILAVVQSAFIAAIADER